MGTWLGRVWDMLVQGSNKWCFEDWKAWGQIRPRVAEGVRHVCSGSERHILGAGTF